MDSRIERGEMKKIAAILAIGMTLLVVASFVVTANGYDEYGYNEKARMFNGWYGHYDRDVDGGWVAGTGDAWLSMKWSKDWTPMADEPIGAWCTNHFTWYADSYDEGSWYGFNERSVWSEKDSAPEANYKIVEFCKIMKVGDDSAAWAEYQAGGAYSAGWGAYLSGVPMYVVFQDVITVFDAETGDEVYSVSLCETPGKGLGQPIF
jgi:hypothetical protein